MYYMLRNEGLTLMYIYSKFIFKLYTRVNFAEYVLNIYGYIQYSNER